MTTNTDMFGGDQLLEELFREPSFLQLIAQQALVDDAQWQLWFDEYPRYQEVNLVARKLYELKYYESTVTFNETYRSEVWEGVVAHLDTSESSKPDRNLGKQSLMRWLQYAAIFICVSALGLWIYFQRATIPSGEKYSSTSYKKEITLPDGTTLWLNKNSTAVYHEDEFGRRLDLTGEGYLHVTKRMEHGKKKPFIVEHDGLKVEVLGTRFNVINTPITKLVALDEGSVRAGYGSGNMIMKPGEVVNVDRGILKRLPIRSGLVNSWQTGILDLDKTTLNEIIIWMELTYRKKVVGRLPSSMMKATVSGKIDVSEQEIVLRSIGNLYKVNISEEKDHFEIKTSE
ncbi:FecR family protein [Sphingobacterium sp. BIGb0165]|uniref:FecR family protein n=1 Tax=Sphingobacterium sp. BIGb0165 TaxID=2940615 RepID=UPI002166EE3F|nr:FecR domain-containing protein [Sphingobacterium sp. BIGb0165]MCS4227039.1 ferric-dicitrate binding protein FerR (iron transport regulator) [Sphingobacterium sp. BIGb0165]